MGIRKDRSIGHIPGQAGGASRKNHQQVAQRHRASGQACREERSRKQKEGGGVAPAQVYLLHSGARAASGNAERKALDTRSLGSWPSGSRRQRKLPRKTMTRLPLMLYRES